MDTAWKMQSSGTGQKRKVRYRFYKKPMSSPYVTPFRLVQPLNGKIASLSQNVFRLMSNRSDETSVAERMEILDKFSSRLEVSGYPIQVAGTILRNGLVNFRKRIVREGETTQM